jgi:hypothetical protein
VFPDGDLHIRNVTAADAGDATFRCVATDVVTGEKVISATVAR